MRTMLGACSCLPFHSLKKAWQAHLREPGKGPFCFWCGAAAEQLAEAAVCNESNALESAVPTLAASTWHRPQASMSSGQLLPPASADR